MKFLFWQIDYVGWNTEVFSMRQLRRIARKGGKIRAIKYLRVFILEMSLKEAKEYVERNCRKFRGINV